MENFIRFCQSHKWMILCIAIGMLSVILLLTIGFWKTLLIFVVIALSAVIGYLLDRGGVAAVNRAFDQLFSKDRPE